MARRISISIPRQSEYTSLSKFVHRRFKSTPVGKARGTVTRTYVEMACPHGGWTGPSPPYRENMRKPLPVIHSDHAPARRGYLHTVGEFEGGIVVHRNRNTITPVLSRHTVDVYPLEAEDTAGTPEKDGEVAAYVTELGSMCYLHRRTLKREVSLTIVTEADAGTPTEIRRAVYTLHSILWLQFSITDVLTVTKLSMAQNLSPQA